ncbi:hypothetical protein IGI43_001142 [Enterococcus sp. AZ126]
MFLLANVSVGISETQANSLESQRLKEPINKLFPDPTFAHYIAKKFR